ncbi:helix-turn-helix domain-containing protein [Aliiruegeria lutimaris]|uniref:helix-turn-helix domain-containing protein n=1 Tax=Aliiruegeria lutimaris TaxID=571298 RepID=UPI003CC7A6DD
MAAVGRVAQSPFVMNMARKSAAETLASNTANIPDDLRLHRARDLLTSEECSVSEIAAELGYRSTSNFSRAFKTKNGKSTAGFRNSLNSGAPNPESST